MSGEIVRLRAELERLKAEALDVCGITYGMLTAGVVDDHDRIMRAANELAEFARRLTGAAPALSERQSTDIVLRGVFLHVPGEKIYIGSAVTGEITDCHFNSGGYVPRFWRRSRLRRFRPFVSDLMSARSLWRWLRD